MSTRTHVACFVLAVLCTSSAFAGVGSGGTRDAIVYVPHLESWSVGIDVLFGQRGIKPQIGRDSTLDVQSAAIVLGYDACTFLTLFGTAGAAQLKPAGESDYGPSLFKWSAGFHANLWRTDIEEPDFMTGTLILKVIGEYNAYDFSGKPRDYSNSPKWSDIWVAIPFTYEMYVETEKITSRIPYSLVFSVGPGFSFIDGKRDGGVSFSEKQSAGVVGGIDLYLAHNLSFGAAVRYFDEITTTGTVSFHF